MQTLFFFIFTDDIGRDVPSSDLSNRPADRTWRVCCAYCCRMPYFCHVSITGNIGSTVIMWIRNLFINHCGMAYGFQTMQDGMKHNGAFVHVMINPHCHNVQIMTAGAEYIPHGFPYAWFQLFKRKPGRGSYRFSWLFFDKRKSRKRCEEMLNHAL